MTEELISKEFNTQIRVIYADTDQMGVVYHSKYLKYFEIGRNEMLRDASFTYKYLESRNVYLPVIEAHLKYIKPARYDDILNIKTKMVREIHKQLRFKMQCQIVSQANELLVEGYTVHIISNKEGKAWRAPKDVYYPLLENIYKID
jgi:acyl-CoA thioester hydrolase